MRRAATRNTLARWLAGLFALLLVTSCAMQLPTVPQLGPNGQVLTGKVVWHDLITPDLARAKAFYGELFGWQFETVTSGYELITNNGLLIGGMASLNDARRASYWLPLISVPDADQVAAATRAAGGENLLPVFELPGRGRIGVLKDPQGAAFGVVATSSGDPSDRPPQLNDWLWHEVWTEDTEAAQAFYQDLGGYQRVSEQVFGTSYTYLASQGRPRFGVIKKASPEIGNTWVAYVRVADAAAVTARAEALGGSVLMAPRPDVRNGAVAILADPSGAGFVIQEWER